MLVAKTFFAVRPNTSKLFELIFSRSEMLMKASCFVAFADYCIHYRREPAAPVSLLSVSSAGMCEFFL